MLNERKNKLFEGSGGEIYLYIESEKERKRERERGLYLHMRVFNYMTQVYLVFKKKSKYLIVWCGYDRQRA